MGSFPALLLPPWASVALGGLAVKWMVVKVLRWLPVELRWAVLNWRAFLAEFRRGGD
jgi:hypothetical protein